MAVLARPVGRGSSDPFYIVQRYNQRCRLYPRVDTVADDPRIICQR